MAPYAFRISDHDNIERAMDWLEAADPHQAVNFALNALAQFACHAFPPPEGIVIEILDDTLASMAKLSFAFTIEYTGMLPL